jgi:hypothetical protein
VTAVPELVTSKAEIESNIRTMERLRTGSPEQHKFWKRRIKNNKYLVVLSGDGRYLFAPRVFAGYRNNGFNHSNHDGWDRRKANQAVDAHADGPIEQGDDRYSPIDAAFIELCTLNGFEPSEHPRARCYWIIGDAPAPGPRALFADEVQSRPTLYEGAVIQITVNRYERNREARAECIAHYGTKCQGCGENLEETYGERGAGFIHVHHIVPLSTIREGYEVDPIGDLRPVCPNCHAMLHVGGATTCSRSRVCGPFSNDAEKRRTRKTTARGFRQRQQDRTRQEIRSFRVPRDRAATWSESARSGRNAAIRLPSSPQPSTTRQR